MAENDREHKIISDKEVPRYKYCNACSWSCFSGNPDFVEQSFLNAHQGKEYRSIDLQRIIF